MSSHVIGIDIDVYSDFAVIFSILITMFGGSI